MNIFIFQRGYKYLARKYNIEIEEEQSKRRKQTNERESMYFGLPNCPKIIFLSLWWERDSRRPIGLKLFKERGYG